MLSSPTKPTAARLVRACAAAVAPVPPCFIGQIVIVIAPQDISAPSLSDGFSTLVLHHSPYEKENRYLIVAVYLMVSQDWVIWLFSSTLQDVKG